jgi:hypothetical protein
MNIVLETNRERCLKLKRLQELAEPPPARATFGGKTYLHGKVK